MELTGNSRAQRRVRLAIARPDRSVDASTRATGLSAFDQAIEHFAHGRWPEAFAKLAPLADAGHREAARIALLMTTRGPRLFGRAFPASPSQRERWHAIANRACTTEPGGE